jgi:hypothetical protein
MEMRNISYHYTDGIAVQVQTMEGKLVPTQAGARRFLTTQNLLI